MSNQVVYEMSLRDQLTGKVEGANAAVNKLEGSLGSVKGLLTGIGVGLAAFKLGEFVHAANEEWDKMEFAMSQVEAGIKSTGGAAGLTFDELKKGAQDASHEIKFTQSEILGMQSVLLTFPKVAGATFSEASTLIADMSTRLGGDLKSSAIQVGKALQDPIRGITALRRSGVNFTESQQNVIKSLVETNQLAKAQAIILQELSVEFGGSALAAAEADKSFRLDKTMEENKVALGEMIDKIKEDLMPVFLAMAKGIGNLIEWIKNNGTVIKQWTIAIVSAVAAFKAITIAVALFGTGVAAAGSAATTAAVGMSTFGAAATAALGPIGLLAAAIGGVVLLYNQLSDAQQKRRQEDSDLRSGAEKDAEEYITQRTRQLEKTMKHDAAEIAAKNEYVSKMSELRQKNYDLVMSSPEGSDAEKIAKARLAYANEAMNAVGKVNVSLLPKPKAGAPGEAGAPGKTPKTQAQGAKSVTINVTIKELGKTTINTTNIKEGMRSLKDGVIAALTGAVNDFQVISGQS